MDVAGMLGLIYFSSYLGGLMSVLGSSIIALCLLPNLWAAAYLAVLVRSHGQWLCLLRSIAKTLRYPQDCWSHPGIRSRTAADLAATELICDYDLTRTPTRSQISRAVSVFLRKLATFRRQLSLNMLVMCAVGYFAYSPGGASIAVWKALHQAVH